MQGLHVHTSRGHSPRYKGPLQGAIVPTCRGQLAPAHGHNGQPRAHPPNVTPTPRRGLIKNLSKKKPYVICLVLSRESVTRMCCGMCMGVIICIGMNGSKCFLYAYGSSGCVVLAPRVCSGGHPGHQRGALPIAKGRVSIINCHALNIDYQVPIIDYQLPSADCQ